jgi:hypothetical protein
MAPPKFDAVYSVSPFVELGSEPSAPRWPYARKSHSIACSPTPCTGDCPPNVFAVLPRVGFG